MCENIIVERILVEINLLLSIKIHFREFWARKRFKVFLSKSLNLRDKNSNLTTTKTNLMLQAAALIYKLAFILLSGLNFMVWIHNF